MTWMIPTKLVYKAATENGSHSYDVFFGSGGGETSGLVTISKRKLDEFGKDNPKVSSDLLTPEKKILLESIKDFDKAGHILMFEQGPVTAEPPLTVPPAMRPVELRYLSEPREKVHLFEVLMEQPDEVQKQYVFEVSDKPAVNLKYPKEFFKDMGGCIDLAAPLFDAIRKFYIAGRPDLGD